MNVSDATDKRKTLTTPLKTLLPPLWGITYAMQPLQKKHVASCGRSSDQSIIPGEEPCTQALIYLAGALDTLDHFADKSEQQERKQINISNSADWI